MKMLIMVFRTFLIFFVGGLFMTAAVISLFLSGGIVWLDCLHDNPNHTCADALFFAAVSPLYGVIIGMAVNFMPLWWELRWPFLVGRFSTMCPCGM